MGKVAQWGFSPKETRNWKIDSSCIGGILITGVLIAESDELLLTIHAIQDHSYNTTSSFNIHTPSSVTITAKPVNADGANLNDSGMQLLWECSGS